MTNQLLALRPSIRRHILPRLLASTLSGAVLATGLPVATLTASSTPAVVGPAIANPLVAVDPGIQPLIRQARPLNRIVYGYLPYWRLDAGTVDRLQYDLISTIAFFGLGIKADGNIDTAWRGYTAYVSDNATAVTNAAHAAGVRVVPTFQLFDSGSLLKMTAFLGSPTAQNRFIGQALDLMARRSADGASIDFEPVPDSVAPSFLAFVAKFGTAMRARFPGSHLVVAASAGAGATLTTGLVPLVDQIFVMTYNYHWSGSTVAGPTAPLDNATRTVKIHITRYLARAPAAKIIMGIGYYGYDWPVTSNIPYASVRSNRAAYGGVWSVTYGSALDWLAANPTVVRNEDTVQGSAWFTYYDTTYQTWREVYFEDEQSIAAKDDYAIVSNLAGIGIWTLGNDRSYPALWNVIRAKFYAPVHAVAVTSAARNVRLRYGRVFVTLSLSVLNQGNVPESGVVHWVIRDTHGRARAIGDQAVTMYPNHGKRWAQAVLVGSARALPSGRYNLYVRFTDTNGRWRAPAFSFRQPY